MNLFEQIGLDIGYVLIGAIGVILILIVLVIVLFHKQKKLIDKYNSFMSGVSGESLENAISERFEEIAKLKQNSQEMQDSIEAIKENLVKTYQKIGIIKYDAFKEMGGKLSFVLVLLTEENNGFLINSMHSSREGCYTYIKEIIKGEAFVLLSEEEKEAVEIAVKSNNIVS